MRWEWEACSSFCHSGGGGGGLPHCRPNPSTQHDVALLYWSQIYAVLHMFSHTFLNHITVLSVAMLLAQMADDERVLDALKLAVFPTLASDRRQQEVYLCT